MYSSMTTPQDAHKRSVLQVYLGFNTLKFSVAKLNAVLVFMVHLSSSSKVFNGEARYS